MFTFLFCCFFYLFSYPGIYSVDQYVIFVLYKLISEQNNNFSADGFSGFLSEGNKMLHTLLIIFFFIILFLLLRYDLLSFQTHNFMTFSAPQSRSFAASSPLHRRHVCLSCRNSALHPGVASLLSSNFRVKLSSCFSQGKSERLLKWFQLAESERPGWRFRLISAHATKHTLLPPGAARCVFTCSAF